MQHWPSFFVVKSEYSWFTLNSSTSDINKNNNNFTGFTEHIVLYNQDLIIMERRCTGICYHFLSVPTFCFSAAINVGSQRLSRVSNNKNTASWEFTRSWRVSTSFFTPSIALSGKNWCFITARSKKKNQEYSSKWSRIKISLKSNLNCSTSFITDDYTQNSFFSIKQIVRMKIKKINNLIDNNDQSKYSVIYQVLHVQA